MQNALGLQELRANLFWKSKYPIGVQRPVIDNFKGDAPGYRRWASVTNTGQAFCAPKAEIMSCWRVGSLKRHGNRKPATNHARIGSKMQGRPRGFLRPTSIGPMATTKMFRTPLTRDTSPKLFSVPAPIAEATAQKTTKASSQNGRYPQARTGLCPRLTL